MNPRGGILSVPVPAEQILHSYRVLRPGQIRGVPWLSPVMMALRDLDDYADAERVRKKIEACVSAWSRSRRASRGLTWSPRRQRPKNKAPDRRVPAVPGGIPEAGTKM